MKKKYYEVVLAGCKQYVSSFNEREAIILAQAEVIRDGLNYELVSISEITIDEFLAKKKKDLQKLK
ncbi:hypothetical protein GCM10023310_70500 [Paenibacillus vulneris]|uniref:Uncharacterized protein n=1 Tax=Paenibacillus vulneris TaxID=1133364 RepID=A0ABW3UF55_9BACL